jgi:hypothetical protein
MKRNLLATIFLLSILYGCSEINGNNDPSQSLESTKWKLASIVDTETGTLKELEPKDCEECYVLTFDTDSSFLTFSSTNELGGGYIADYETYSFQVTCFGGTKVGEIGDGQLYARLFGEGLIQSFSVSKNELRLYYNDNKNYLLFKSQQP